jgi:hypothetical protein
MLSMDRSNEMNDIDELTLVARLRADVRTGAELTQAWQQLAAEISAASAVGLASADLRLAADRGPAGDRRVAVGRSVAEDRHLAVDRSLAADRGPAPRWRGLRGRGAVAGSRRLAVGAVAAVLAVAATVVAVLVVGGAPGHQGPAVGGGTGRTGPTGPAGPNPGPAVTETQLVDYATRAAAAAPPFSPGPHDWIYARIEMAASSAGTGGFLFGPPNERVTTSVWTRVDLSLAASLSHGKLTFSQMFPGTLIGWPSISYRYLESLPTDPAALEAVIRANLRHDRVVRPGQVEIFEAIDYLMSSQVRAVLPPRLQAGLYGVLSRLPDVRFDRTTDIAGRSGLGLSIIEEGYINAQIVINPRTYAYMGDLFVAVKAHTAVGLDGTRQIKLGQVLGWTAILRSGIVRHAGQLP